MTLFPSGRTAQHGRGALAAGWLLAALSPPGAAASSPPHEAQVAGPTEQIAALDQAIPGLMARAGIPGLSIAVVQNGEVAWTGAYGIMSTETQAPVTHRTAFEAASLSKPVFTLVVLDAVERGVLDLDTPISEVFSYKRFANDTRVGLITPRMVLSHKTGLPNWDREGTLDFDRDPGLRFGYSGEGFVYLQKALEATEGRRLEDLTREVVFEPFGMEDSSFLWRDDYETRLAGGHDGDGVAAERNRYAEENAAYSLVTTACDFGTFLARVMKGVNLSEGLYDDMLARHTSMRGGETKTEHPPEIWQAIHWGLSWGIQDAGGGRIYFHWGDNDVYHAFAAFSPAHGTGFVYFTNSQNGLRIANQLATIVVGDMSPAITWLGYGGLDTEPDDGDS